jgi:phosphatidate cytidylyltransferase
VKRILTALVLIPLVLLAVFRAPLWLYLLITLVVALLAAYEYLAIVADFGMEPYRLLVYIFTGAFFAVYFYANSAGVGALLAGLLLLFLFAPFLMLTEAMAREELRTAIPAVGLSYMALPYIAMPMLLTAVLRDFRRGWVFVLFTFFAVWVGDTAAMYVGKSMGRHKLSPRISPGKTVEGAVASLLFAVAVCAAFAHWLPEIAHALQSIHLLVERGRESLLYEAPAYGRAPFWLAASIAAVVNVAAQVGDLLESALKRGAGVKDSGTLLPGHGGILDRIDALLLALPVAFLLFLAYGERFVRG